MRRCQSRRPYPFHVFTGVLVCSILSQCGQANTCTTAFSAATRVDRDQLIWSNERADQAASSYRSIWRQRSRQIARSWKPFDQLSPGDAEIVAKAIAEGIAEGRRHGLEMASWAEHVHPRHRRSVFAAIISAVSIAFRSPPETICVVSKSYLSLATASPNLI